MGVRKVHVSQIDTEGYDFEILKLFRVEERLPQLISFGHMHSSSDWNAAVSMLTGCGYSVAKAGFDTIAIRIAESGAMRSAPLP